MYATTSKQHFTEIANYHVKRCEFSSQQAFCKHGWDLAVREQRPWLAIARLNDC